MPKPTLTITRRGETAQITLDPKGTIIGRTPSCDVFLDGPQVSRRHARIFRDPFGRWIVEDLGSTNGVRIGGKRVTAHAMLPGQTLYIGAFSLSLEEEYDRPIAADSTASSARTNVYESADANVMLGAEGSGRSLSHERLRQLNTVIDRLALVTDEAELYPEACRCLADGPQNGPQTFATVLRLPADGEGMPGSLQILSYQLGSKEVDDDVGPANLHLSRGVLEAVRLSEGPVMAANAEDSEQDLQLTVFDNRRPRSVFASPITNVASKMDVLYIDSPFGADGEEKLDLVRAIAREVDSARKGLLLSNVLAERHALDGELDRARAIQSKLTPKLTDKLPGVDAVVHYEPAMWVGGDYCDILPLSDGRLAFAVGDVSGNGLHAALVMMSLHASIRTALSFCTELWKVLAHVNEHLDQHLPQDMFATLVLGLFEPSTGHLEYVNAGHIVPTIVHPSSGARPLGEPRNPPLCGIHHDYKTESEVLEPGETLLVVTDGVVEAKSAEGEEMGMSFLTRLVEERKPQTSRRLVDLVVEATSEFRGHLPQQDDVTVFALRNDG
jgi:sigma-B regulation protein RsbU (phosphoserine phosphatase)